MTFDIRPATRDDLANVRELLGATWHATYDGIYGTDRVAEITGRWHAIAALAQGLDRPGNCFLVALVDGVIAGTASASQVAGGELVLHRLYVAPASQGRGIGRALLDACLAAFDRAPGMRLEVEPANARAVAFYERNGFVITGRSADCGGSGDRIPAVVMRRVSSGA